MFNIVEKTFKSAPLFVRAAVVLVTGTASFCYLQESSAAIDGHCAASFPDKKVRWVVPYTVGGGYDTYSRLLRPFISEALAARVIVENVAGSGGIAGAQAIRDASPDGSTLGIVNDSGLLVAAIGAVNDVPDPANDFTILGRIAPARQIWATGASSSLHDMEDVLGLAEKTGIVFGIRSIGSTAFINVVVASKLLHAKAYVVAGFSGTPHLALATIRGDVDLISGNFESLLKWIEAGELRPLLQIGDKRISLHESLEEVPLLGGPDGWAERRAREVLRSVESAREDAAALSLLIGGGRLVVAPRGLKEGTAECLRRALADSLENPRFRKIAASANLSISPSDASDAKLEVEEAIRGLKRFEAIMQEFAVSVND